MNRAPRLVQGRCKGKTTRLPDNEPQTSRVVTAHESIRDLPYEIVEMIFTYLIRDLNTIKACSLTCRSWYVVAAPRIHHTLLLREARRKIPHFGLKPLSELHDRGLMPFVKEIRIRQWNSYWFFPQAFSPRDLHHFTAFVNVRILRIHALDIDCFIPSLGRHFEGFMPTLRSIALHFPSCTPRQLSFFLSLFSNLDDIEIWWNSHLRPCKPNTTPPTIPVLPAQNLRGQLKLYSFRRFDGWVDLMTSFRGQQFRYIELSKVGSYAPVLLEACAETLETLRFYPRCGRVGRPFSMNPIYSS